MVNAMYCLYWAKSYQDHFKNIILEYTNEDISRRDYHLSQLTEGRESTALILMMSSISLRAWIEHKRQCHPKPGKSVLSSP